MDHKAKQVQAGDEEDEYVDLTPKQYLAMINFVKKKPTAVGQGTGRLSQQCYHKQAVRGNVANDTSVGWHR